jgi:hypothetical protein
MRKYLIFYIINIILNGKIHLLGKIKINKGKNEINFIIIVI